MKKKHKILPALICLLALVLADPYVAYAEKDEPETASKTIKITTKSGKDDGNNADEEDLGPGERSKEDEENHVEKEDGNSEKTGNYLIERMDVTEMTEVRIGSYEDWVDFAKKCTLDTWSVDKYVVLTDNIDFNMKEFVPVPYFAGVLDGNKKTVNKVAFTGEDNYVGLFSKTAPTAVIRNLNVIGVMKPTGKPFNIGGIVGDNSGMIANCKFEGYVEGYDYIGGIAGYNGSTGIISACFATGKITGLHHVGGMCGTNVGLVTGCSSKADINTVTKEVETGIKDIKVEELFTSLINEGKQNDQKMSIRSSNNPVDIGGIVGHNTGEISSCVNESTVGYEHVGYNVGGIAGRQSGYVHDCDNKGKLQGRKDVGGIVGQAEPYIRLDLDSDVIAQISKAISTLHDSVEKTINDTDSSSGTVSARLNVIKNFADNALSDTGYLANSTQDYVNGVVGATNEIVGRIEYVVSETSSDEGPMKDVEDAGRHLRETAENLEEVVGDLDIDNYMEDGEREAYDAAKKNLAKATDEFAGYSDMDYYEQLTNNGTELNPAGPLPNRPTREQIIQAEKDAIDIDGKTEADLAEYQDKAITFANTVYKNKHANRSYAEDMESYSGTIARSVIDHSDEMIDDVEEDSQEALKEAKKMAGDLRDAGKGMRSILKSAVEKGAVRFPQLSEEYRMHTNSLVANIQGMSDNLGFLNNEMRGSTETVCNDLEGVNDDFSSLLLLMTDAMDGALDMDYSEVFEDESDVVCEESVDATIMKCDNSGSIYGDIDTGGIAGTMAQEYDFDLEGDITGVKNAAKKSTYRTKCVLRDNVNRGFVKGKKSYVGGVCGLHEIGTILRCDDYAKVASESGDYIGGIAGRSYSTINGCHEKGVLSGGSYIGGIAGAAEDILDSVAMPTIVKGTNFKGAVAGSADEGGKIAGNVFVSDSLAGIDRISREGGAYPVSYGELLAMDGIPSDYTRIKVDFIVDEKIVASLSKRAGEVIAPSETPMETEVAEKEEKNNKKKPKDTDKIILAQDEYIDWDCDEEIAVYEDTEINGEVKRFTTTLASEEVRENKQSVFLVDGNFIDGDRMTVDAYVSNEKLTVQYVLKIPDDGKESHLIRYLSAEDSGDESIFIKNGNEYVPVETTAYGDYVTFEAPGNTVELKISGSGSGELKDKILGYAKIVGAIVLVLIMIRVIVWRIKAHRRKKSKK